TARATVNCRILPDHPVDEVEATLRRVLEDEKIALTRTTEPVLSPPSPLDPGLMAAVERLTAEMWPGVPVVPIMSTGATDARFLPNIGMPVYGVSGLFSEPGANGVHGLNEQIGVQSLYNGHAFLYQLVKLLAAEGGAN